jgi:predicted nuclease of predicted toxin-antitoxin system
MKLYLDDDMANPLLAQALRRAGHDVQTPSDAGMSGRSDPEHLTYAIWVGRIVLTRNFRDFERLHFLIMQAQGRHSGILLVRRDNDPRRNMKAHEIVRALRGLETSGLPVAHACLTLNKWR